MADSVEIRDYGGKVSNALSDMLKIKLKDVRKILNDISLGDYLDLVLAIDEGNVAKVKEVMKNMSNKEGKQTESFLKWISDPLMEKDKKGKTSKRRSFDAATVTRRTGAGPHKKKSTDDEVSGVKRPKGHRGKNIKDYVDVDEAGEKEMDNKLYIGESVTYEGRKAIVRSIDSEKGEVGITREGEKKIIMVNESGIERLNENGVTGITDMPIINSDEVKVKDVTLDRMQQLAGIKKDVIEEKKEEVEEEEKEEVDEDIMDDEVLDPHALGAPPVDASSLVDPMDDLDAAPLPAPVDGIGDVDHSMEDGLGGGMGDEIDPGLYPDFSTDFDPNSIDADKSEAYNSICSSLDQVRALMGEVKLDEFKELVGKVESLSTEVKSLGKSYLGEKKNIRRRAKK